MASVTRRGSTRHQASPSSADGTLYVADTGNNAIRRITPDGVVSTLAGDGVAGDADGPARERALQRAASASPSTPDGRVIVADTYNDRIRAIDRDGNVTTLAGGDEPGFADGPATDARFDTPSGVAVDATAASSSPTPATASCASSIARQIGDAR